MWRERLISFILAYAFVGFGLVAFAEPLDKQSCASLQAERKQLLTREMQTALDQGADWVKKHLSEDEIDKVRKFLTIEEQIEFRCRGGGITKVENKSQPLKPGDMPLPDRNPTRPASPATESGASQALVDSDKTAPEKAGTTR